MSPPPPPAVPAPRVVLDSNVWIDLLVFRDYLTAVLAHTENEIAAGRTREQIITLTNLPGFEDFHVQTGSRLPANLGAAYDELVLGHGSAILALPSRLERLF